MSKPKLFQFVLLLFLVILSFSVFPEQSPITFPSSVTPINAAPTANATFGNPTLPFDNVSIIENSDFVIVDNNDFVFKFRKGTAGYNEIWQNGSILVQDDRWRLEYEFKPDDWRMRGQPRNVTWIQKKPHSVEVTRAFDDFLGTSFNLTYTIADRTKTKIELKGYVQPDNYRAVWQPSGINKNYGTQGNNQTKFWNGNETETAIVFDYEDVSYYFGNVTTVNVELKAGGHKLTQTFAVGFLNGSFTIDPTFGYDWEGGNWMSCKDQILGSVFTCPLSGTPWWIYCYVRAEKVGTTKYFSAAIYKHIQNDTDISGWTNYRRTKMDLVAFVDTNMSVTYDDSYPDGVWESAQLSYYDKLIAGMEYVLVIWGDDGPAEDISIAWDNTGNAWQYHEYPGLLPYDGDWAMYDEDIPFEDKDIWTRKLSIYVDYTEEANVPTIGSLEAPSETYAYTPFMLNATVNDASGVSDLKFVWLELTYRFGGYTNNVVLKWKASTDTFSESSDPQNLCSLNVSGSASSQLNNTAYKLTFLMSLRWNYTEGNFSIARYNSMVTDQSNCGTSTTSLNISYFENDIFVASGSYSPEEPRINQSVKFTGQLYFEGSTVGPENYLTAYVSLDGVVQDSTTTFTTGSFELDVNMPSAGGTYTYVLYAVNTVNSVTFQNQTLQIIVFVDITLQAKDVTETDLSKTINFKGTHANGTSFNVDSSSSGSYTLTTVAGDLTLNTWWGNHLVDSRTISVTDDATENIDTKVQRLSSGSNYLLFSLNNTDLTTPELIGTYDWRMENITATGSIEFKMDNSNWIKTSEPYSFTTSSQTWTSGTGTWSFSDNLFTFTVDFSTKTLSMLWDEPSEDEDEGSAGPGGYTPPEEEPFYYLPPPTEPTEPEPTTPTIPVEYYESPFLSVGVIIIIGSIGFVVFYGEMSRRKPSLSRLFKERAKHIKITAFDNKSVKVTSSKKKPPKVKPFGSKKK